MSRPVDENVVRSVLWRVSVYVPSPLARSALSDHPVLRWQPTGGGFFAFVRIVNGQRSEPLAASLLEHAHVVTIPGAAFGRAGEGFLRLSYGAVSVDELVEGCGRCAEIAD